MNKANCYKFDFNYFQYSKISLKVKGEGYNTILGTDSNIDTNNNFNGMNFLIEIKINGKTEATKKKMYYFNELDNSVDLIWNDNIDNCDNMFYECENITEIDLSGFITTKVASMGRMFFSCISLTSINLSNFKTSKVTIMSFMFYNCSKLTSIDVSSFRTSKVTKTDRMFSYCLSLRSLDITHFDTSNVNDMKVMFNHCSSLTSLDLSHFNTTLASSFKSMFDTCISLTSLDLSTFNTINIKDMSYMFEKCYSLTSLNLNNFNTLKVTSMYNMFHGCTNLEYINLKNFVESTSLNADGMFLNAPNNVVICINSQKAKDKIYPQIQSLKCYSIDCSNNWSLKQKKIFNNNECAESCDITEYKYEFNGKCYDNCTYGFLYDDNNNKMNKCKCPLAQCLLCPSVAFNDNLCTKCNNNYYPKENDPLNLGSYINCYYQPEGYYLDNNLYKKCYHTCQSCYAEGDNLNHNCIKCNGNFPFSAKINDYFNCYENCSFYHYFDDENNTICTMDFNCPNDYSKLLESKRECIKNDIIDTTLNTINEKNEIIDSTIKVLMNEIVNSTFNILTEKNEIVDSTLNILNNEYINITKNTFYNEINKIETEYSYNILYIIEKNITSNDYDTSDLDNKKDQIIIAEKEKLIITITTVQNQRNNIYHNMTRIDLGECENQLRNFYNLTYNETLYIKKIDAIQDGMKTLKVEYDVYAKLFGKNLINLNLSVCGESKISILIPIILKEHIDKHNISSGYYNDNSKMLK